MKVIAGMCVRAIRFSFYFNGLLLYKIAFFGFPKLGKTVQNTFKLNENAIVASHKKDKKGFKIVFGTGLRCLVTF